MDLSIIEDVFALRERMEKAQLGVDVPELPELAKIAQEDDEKLFQSLEHLRDEKEVARTMDRATKLAAEIDKWHEAADAPKQRLRPEMVDLLTAASAPLPAFEDAELTPVAVPTAATTASKTPARKAAKKPSKSSTRKPKKKPE
ncbi:MAG TPA: hypothetical protein VF461_14745 [Gemmatimonadaceae bacterium]